MKNVLSIKHCIATAVLTLLILAGYLLGEAVVSHRELLDSSAYQDADILYHKYFGRFQLSDLAEQQIKVELQMIANAIALEKQQRKDLAAMLFVAEQIATRKITEEQVLREIMELDDNLHSFQQWDMEQNQFADETPPAWSDQAENVSCPDFIEYIHDQQALVTNHGLPYQIDNSAVQVMDIRGNRFLKVEADKPDKGNRHAFAGKNDIAIRHTQLRNFPWQPADIILGHSETQEIGVSIQGYWNHAGIYSKREQGVIDVWPAGDSGSTIGVRQSDLRFWAEQFTDLAVLRLPEISETTRERIETAAISRLGEPYNITTHKMNPGGGWYCSKLIYWLYLQEGLDLDPSGGVSVFPDDLAMGSNLNRLICFSGDN